MNYVQNFTVSDVYDEFTSNEIFIEGVDLSTCQQLLRILVYAPTGKRSRYRHQGARTVSNLKWSN